MTEITWEQYESVQKLFPGCAIDVMQDEVSLTIKVWENNE